jgi:hypothetical protein
VEISIEEVYVPREERPRKSIGLDVVEANETGTGVDHRN